MIEVNFAQTLRDQIEIDLRSAINDEYTKFMFSVRSQFKDAQKELKRTVRFEFTYKENLDKAVEVLNKGGFKTTVISTQTKRYIADASY